MMHKLLGICVSKEAYVSWVKMSHPSWMETEQAALWKILKVVPAHVHVSIFAFPHLGHFYFNEQAFQW